MLHARRARKQRGVRFRDAPPLWPLAGHRDTFAVAMGFLLSGTAHRENNLPVLEGIRGMAVVLVVLSHMSTAGVFFSPSLTFRGAGTYGVYLFFVLSAFLLTRQFLQRPPAPPASASYWSAYAVRRLARIYPLYTIALMTTAVWPLASFALAGREQPSILRHLLLLDGQKIFWTIPVEMKFYALLPALLLAMQAVGRGRAWRSAAFLSAVLVASSIVLAPEQSAHRSIALRDYLSLFLFGSIAAVAWQAFAGRQRSRFVRWSSDLLAVVFLLAVLAPWMLDSPLGATHRFVETWLGSDAAWYGAAWALFLVATLAGEGLTRRVFESGPLRIAGLASFSAYLWHMPVIAVVRTRVADFRAPVAATAVLAAVAAVSVLSYVVVERPAIMATSKWSRRRAAAASA